MKYKIKEKSCTFRRHLFDSLRLHHRSSKWSKKMEPKKCWQGPLPSRGNVTSHEFSTDTHTHKKVTPHTHMHAITGRSVASIPHPRELLSETRFPLRARRSWCWGHKSPADGRWIRGQNDYFDIESMVLQRGAELRRRVSNHGTRGGSIPVTSQKERKGFDTLIRGSAYSQQERHGKQAFGEESNDFFFFYQYLERIFHRNPIWRHIRANHCCYTRLRIGCQRVLYVCDFFSSKCISTASLSWLTPLTNKRTV